VIESVGDSVNLSLRTTSGGFRHETIPTGVARAMHIEKGDAIAFAKFAAFDIEEVTANLAQVANRHVARNQWVGNALQKSPLKVNVCAADLRQFDLKQSRIFFEFG